MLHALCLNKTLSDRKPVIYDRRQAVARFLFLALKTRDRVWSVTSSDDSAILLLLLGGIVQVLKILKKLQDLDITLDILSETGIGKLVNSFRKHDQAGKVAKMLVNRWKALVPKDSLSGEQPNKEVEERRSSHLSESTNSRKKPKSDNFSANKKTSQNNDVESEMKSSKSEASLNGVKKDRATKDSRTSKSHSHGKEKAISTDHMKCEDKKTEKVSSITKKQPNPTLVRAKALKSAAVQSEKSADASKKDTMNKTKEKVKMMGEKACFETPSMSFEAYLSYDYAPPKRKKSFSAVKNPKRRKTAQKENSQVRESCVKTPEVVSEDPLTMAPEHSLTDLLNVPLPTISPECEDISQYQYFGEMKAETKVMDVAEEDPVFIGQRLKNKMQVYSGNKITYLPAMMTLYQQCIRALQNNIDSLYEIGGVPFEILEPVLERCTPEQLLRIEEYNPVYIGVTDHLWERHCLKDFRNAQLEEYESWREMYLRMSEERERKLKQLTKSIVSAHSGKPKGRQVKMAFIHSAAKPPRNVRIQQEIHGTAGPVIVPRPTDKPSTVKLHESHGRSNFSESSKPSNSSGQTHDPRKMKRVAPMMAKSLKAFKKQICRR
ncbi:elongin A, like isoform X1 [Paramisgurnus dabryanus]|uniref:elongin A, like isoform X1 n=1 Tax=Paramisgurnus dabryanus TaxID=90735 RepID=UPI0031F45287